MLSFEIINAMAGRCCPVITLKHEKTGVPICETPVDDHYSLVIRLLDRTYFSSTVAPTSSS